MFDRKKYEKEYYAKRKEWYKEYYAKRYSRFKSAGMCTACGVLLPEGARGVNCERCKEKQRERKARQILKEIRTKLKGE